MRSDLDVCRDLLVTGSKSFAFAAKLLPERIREPATAFYAFCRIADDAVDDSPDPRQALDELRVRVDGIFGGAPHDHPVDRAFSRIALTQELPRTPIDALLEGFEWDVSPRLYPSLGDLRAYCIRVASTVGFVMTHFMGERDPHVLARAIDLGVAMQLTNIARDVGEDAERGRLYLPADWFRELGVNPRSWLRYPNMNEQVGRVVQRVLAEAARLYRRADAGIAALPADCRLAIRTASHVYADIGRALARNGFDPISDRAYVPAPRKAWLALRSLTSDERNSRADLAAPCLPEGQFLLPVPAQPAKDRVA